MYSIFSCLSQNNNINNSNNNNNNMLPQKRHANNKVSNVSIAQTIKFRMSGLHKQSFVCLGCTNNKVLNVSVAQTIKFRMSRNIQNFVCAIDTFKTLFMQSRH